MRYRNANEASAIVPRSGRAPLSRKFWLGLFGACWAFGLMGAAEVPVSQLDLGQLATTHWSAPPKAAKAKRPIKIGGKSYEDGFGTWGSSSLRLGLDGHAQRL